jgi:hypothetical protein
MRIALSVLTLVLLFGIETAGAQAPETRTWLGAGLGAAVRGGDHDADIALSLNLSHRRGAHVFSLRGVVAFEFLGDDVSDVGLLYGRSLTSGAVFATAGGGLGVVSGTRRSGGLFGGGYSESFGPTIGIPLEAQLFVRVLSFLGVGVYGFANTNVEKSLLGATVAVQLGALR